MGPTIHGTRSIQKGERALQCPSAILCQSSV
ncbi:hypothetical protein ACHAXR_003353, partial [Thalassiosira sp. AJA248-18]